MVAVLVAVTLFFAFYSSISALPRAPNEEWYYGRPEPGLMTEGGVWPLPWNITYDKFNHTVNPSTFQFIAFYNCDILDKARSRYMKLMFPGSLGQASGGPSTLDGLVINVYSPCPTGFPQLDMDESCTFTMQCNFVNIHSI